MDDGGYFEDGVFGYDFSEGYTSLEANAAKVHPYRESRDQAVETSSLRTSTPASSGPRGRGRAAGWTKSSRKLYREGRPALTEEGASVPGSGQRRIATGPRLHD